MRLFGYILFSLSFVSVIAFGQGIERKIIIENDTYYYISVDDNYQIGTLYTGEINEPLQSAKALALPVGRGISAQTNPLAWDIRDSQLFAVNFLDHYLNDRNEAIKRISINDLRTWSSGVNMEEMIMKSVDLEMYALNEPYLFTRERSKYLNHFYFDGVVLGENYWMVMTNNGELSVWKYDGTGWENSEVFDFPVSNFVSLITYENTLRLVDAKGTVYTVGLDGIQTTQLAPSGFDLAQSVVIENRDAGKINYIKKNQFSLEKSLQEIVAESGVELIKK